MFCKWCGQALRAPGERCPHCGNEQPPLSECGGFYNLGDNSLIRRSVPQHRENPAGGDARNNPSSCKRDGRSGIIALICNGLLLILIITLSCFLMVRMQRLQEQGENQQLQIEALVQQLSETEPVPTAQETTMPTTEFPTEESTNTENENVTQERTLDLTQEQLEFHYVYGDSEATSEKIDSNRIAFNFETNEIGSGAQHCEGIMQIDGYGVVFTIQCDVEYHDISKTISVVYNLPDGGDEQLGSYKDKTIELYVMRDGEEINIDGIDGILCEFKDLEQGREFNIQDADNRLWNIESYKIVLKRLNETGGELVISIIIPVEQRNSME